MTPEPHRRLRIISLSCIFPTVDEPQRGVFVRARLAALARLADVRVVAPVGLVRWGASDRFRFGGSHPKNRLDHDLRVTYPRWVYAPGSGWLNGVMLFVQLLPRFARLRRKHGWDLLDAHFGHPAGIAAALLSCVFRCPFTVTLRGNELELSRSRIRRKLMGWALRKSDHVFAVSTELRELAHSMGVPRTKTALAPNGVDTSLFRANDRFDARKKLGLDPDLDIVLTVASLTPRKRILDLLEAFSSLIPSFPNLRLVIIGGEGVGERRYARKVRELSSRAPWRGKVTLPGKMTQASLVEWLNAADLFCLASEREGCPNAVLEALACGLPVVATRVGAIPDLVSSPDGGLMTEARNPVALADTLRRALEMDWNRQAISERGRSRSWDQVAAELLPRFEAVVHNSRQKQGGALLRPVIRGGRNAILLARNPFSKPHPRPVFILGNQKSGTSAIAALLGMMTGLPATVDLRREIGRQYYKRIVNGERSFDSLVRRNRLDFSRPIVKEPNLTLFLPELRNRYPESRYVFVVRDPHQNIRSILDRVSIPGDLDTLESQRTSNVDPGFELVLDGRWIGIEAGEHYIDRLCARWNRLVDVYLDASDLLRLVRYEDFQQDKLRCLQSLATDLGLTVQNDIRKSLDRPFQQPGRADVDLRTFFGTNFDRISEACGERMARVGYSGSESGL